MVLPHAKTAHVLVMLVSSILPMMSVAAQDTSPKDVEAAVARLEKLLGAFQPKDARQYRMQIDSEYKNKPENDKPPVVVVSKGEVIFGTPYRIGGAVAFDVIESIKRVIYDVPDDGTKKISQRQQRYLVKRYSLRVDEHGNWTLDCVFLTHSGPASIGRPNLIGNVKWLDNGIELSGIGTDSVYGADGKMLPVAVHVKWRLKRDGDKLSLDDNWQNYQRGTDLDGNSLPFPDFAKPVGSRSSWLTGVATLD